MSEFKKIRGINNPFNNAPVYYTEKTLSTMILAKESDFPVSAGAVFMAGMQSGGRGRIPGRKWEAVKDKNLLFTLILSKAELGPNPLPIVIGLGIAKYLEKNHQLKPSIKWPNDIYVHGRKIAGIIIESRNGLFNIGIGINVNQTDFPSSISGTATSLTREKEENFDLFSELELLLHELKSVLGNNEWQYEIKSRLYNMGNKVSVSSGIPGKEKILTGIIEGIGPEGQLLLKSNGNLVEIYSGEVET